MPEPDHPPTQAASCPAAGHSRPGTLSGKVALVCGAFSGIGAAVVARFAHEGALVVACGTPLPLLDDSLTALGARALPCDVTDDAQVRATVAQALAWHGRLDILVNAAGILHNDRADDIDDALWARQHDVNLAGTMRSLRAVLPHMLAKRSGAVVNIASVAAFNGGADSASYAASKAGVVALTRSAAQASGPAGVRVNALCPGWVDTPMSQKEMRDLAAELGTSEEHARQHTVGRIALGRMAQPAEIAAACVFLASDEASFITGAALVVDGGTRVAAAARAV